MGGIGTSIKVEKASASQSCDPRELHEGLFDLIHNAMYRTLARRQNAYTLGEYIGDERYSGYERNRWYYHEEQGELSYAFFDAAGCCSLSMEAALHWFQLAFALERPSLDHFAKERGWTITGPDTSVGSLVRFGTSCPLLYIGDDLYAMGRARWKAPLDDDTIFGNDGSNPPSLSTLDPQAREKVERIAITGRCDCEMCSLGRKRLKPKLKRGARKPLDEKKTYAAVPRAWALMQDDPDGVQMAQAATATLRAYSEDDWLADPWGPPELQVLDDWLESRDAKVATTDLTRMVDHLRRVSSE